VPRRTECHLANRDRLALNQLGQVAIFANIANTATPNIAGAKTASTHSMISWSFGDIAVQSSSIQQTEPQVLSGIVTAGVPFVALYTYQGASEGRPQRNMYIIA